MSCIRAYGAQVGMPSYTPLYQTVAAMQNVTQPGSVNDRCLAAYPASQQWKCFMAQYTLPFIRTPLFMTQVRLPAGRGLRLDCDCDCDSMPVYACVCVCVCGRIWTTHGR